MKRVISMSLIAAMLMQSVSQAFVDRVIIVSSEKIIPFSFVSEEQYLEEDLSIKGFSDVEIKEMYVDNGEMSAKVDGNYIEVDFSEGEWANSYKTINKVKSVDLDNVILTDENKKTIVIQPDVDVKGIMGVSGDFSDAKINEDGNIEITVQDNAEGFIRYDEDCLIKSEFAIDINDENLDREVARTINLPYEPVGSIVARSGDTSTVSGIYVDGKEVTVDFNNGTPVANETVVNSGHTFFWIDRNENGLFNKYNPNSVYSTDINRITGEGDYIGENEFSEIGLTVYDDKWQDYCGIEKNGVRYIYVYDNKRGIPDLFLGSVVEDNCITFNEQNFNSEKYSVELSNTGVSYIPEGKLYSVGELVKNTNGWGEVAPNREWESAKMFFNELTGKYETYVKHFKFFYGPKQKKTFGGYYTYPYTCTFEYQHYKPITAYSGEVIYEYDSIEKVKGYTYNGWIKIKYKAEKKVNDYPPIAPFNVRYNDFSGNITWNSGNDDYTPKEELKYEIQVFDGEWKQAFYDCFEELKVYYKIDYSDLDIRIRTVDEMGQVSDWAYLEDTPIELTGEIKPYIVNPGDSINIFANTKSLEKIQSVVAKNDEMQMYTELQKTEEDISDFFEMSYDIEATFPEDIDEYFSVTGRAALGSKLEVDSYKFSFADKFDTGSIKFDVIEDVIMDKSGTFIFSNLNYDNIPVDMFKYNSKTWFVGWRNKININNKITEGVDIFLEIQSDTATAAVGNKTVIVPEYIITVNKFEYDENGEPIYEYINVDKNILSTPVVLTWNTDVYGVTTFELYLGNELIYTNAAKWEDINKHVDKFKSIYMYKQMKKFVKSTYGYTTPSKTERAKWNKIVLSIIPNYDLRIFTWLGYRVKENEYVKQQYVDEYNSNPKVRNNYRLLVSNNQLSQNAIKRYMNILKTTNIPMTEAQETIFGDDVMEYTSAFQGSDIKIPEGIRLGTYEITLVATDVQGNVAEIKLTLVVQNDENFKNEEDVEGNENFDDSDKSTIVEKNLGRFFYREEKGYLEELKKTAEIDVEGFLSAGETLGFIVLAKDTEYIEIDFLGDNSIKTLDNLTKKFLIDTPLKNGKNTEEIEEQYVNFPKKIYPQYVDNDELQMYKWFYVIPYKTSQTLASWSTLKNSTLEKIDKTKLFERINTPYSLAIYPNGNREKAVYLDFDVFERWDTVLNRDVTEYIVNSDTKWEMRIDK